MEEISNTQTDEKLKIWIKQKLDSAVRELMEQGLFNSVMVEAKPAWVFPFGLLIGKIREQDQATGFDWFICGDFPTARIHSSVATTAREAARHFALQWQLEAKRLEDSSAQATNGHASDPGAAKTGSQLEEMAHSLYEFVEQDSLWQE